MKAERSATNEALGGHAWQIGGMSPPLTIRLTRVAPSNGLDSDNLLSSMKGVRDEIAAFLEVDDKDSKDGLSWSYGQRRGKTYAVVVEFLEGGEDGFH